MARIDVDANPVVFCQFAFAGGALEDGNTDLPDSAEEINDSILVVRETDITRNTWKQGREGGGRGGRK